MSEEINHRQRQKKVLGPKQLFTNELMMQCLVLNVGNCLPFVRDFPALSLWVQFSTVVKAKWDVPS